MGKNRVGLVGMDVILDIDGDEALKLLSGA